MILRLLVVRGEFFIKNIIPSQAAKTVQTVYGFVHHFISH